jgi:hypothetical protein
MERREIAMLKAFALLMVFTGAAALIAGLLGGIGPDLIPVSPWILVILGSFAFLSGYGLFRKDLDEFEH